MLESNRSAAARFTSTAIALSSLLIAGACSKPADRQADSTRVASGRSGDSAMFNDSAAARSESRPGTSTDALKLSSEQGEVIDALVSLGGKPEAWRRDRL
jgi:hypothetical protein